MMADEGATTIAISIRVALMAEELISSDVALLDLLRKRERLTVSELAEAMQVTATAVRQRLTRLMGQRLIERTTSRVGRGRPSHYYTLTPQGLRQTGANFADLAIALWHELRDIEDPEIRRGLLTRVAKRMADNYTDLVQGDTLEERLQGVVELFGERRLPFAVQKEGDLPVLTVLACPYPDLASVDRGVCAMERQLFSALAGEGLRLRECRLDGAACCEFAPARRGETPEPAVV